jgi:hypothetical protein
MIDEEEFAALPAGSLQDSYRDTPW